MGSDLLGEDSGAALKAQISAAGIQGQEHTFWS